MFELGLHLARQGAPASVFVRRGLKKRFRSSSVGRVLAVSSEGGEGGGRASEGGTFFVFFLHIGTSPGGFDGISALV